MLKPGGVVVKHWGLWSPRREFESLPGYHFHTIIYAICFASRISARALQLSFFRASFAIASTFCNSSIVMARQLCTGFFVSLKLRSRLIPLILKKEDFLCPFSLSFLSSQVYLVGSGIQMSSSSYSACHLYV